MSEGYRTAIPLMRLIEEIADQRIRSFDSCTKVHCKMFEDNMGAMPCPIRPRTK